MWKNILDCSFGMLGDKQEEGRPTILVIHGAAGNTASLKYFWQSLQARANLAAINLPGRDNPSHSLDNISSLAAYTMGFITGSATAKPWLVGHSLGAATALEVAHKWADAIAGLILFNAAALLPLTDGLIFSLGNNTFPPAIGNFLRKAFAPEARPELVEEYLTLVRGMPRMTIINDFKACRTFNAMPYLKSIKLPVLVVTGEKDVVTRPIEGYRLANMLPNAKLVSLGAVGHMGPYEAPEKASELIINFIETG